MSSSVQASRCPGVQTSDVQASRCPDVQMQSSNGGFLQGPQASRQPCLSLTYLWHMKSVRGKQSNFDPTPNRKRLKCIKPMRRAAGPPVYIDSGAFYRASYGSLPRAHHGECADLVSGASSHRQQGTIWTFLLGYVNLFSWDTCHLRTCSLTRSRRNSECVSFSIFEPEN